MESLKQSVRRYTAVDFLFVWLVLLVVIYLLFGLRDRITRLEKASLDEMDQHEEAVWKHLEEWERRMYLERENRIGDLRKEFNQCIYTLSHPDGKLTNIIIWKPEHE